MRHFDVPRVHAARSRTTHRPARRRPNPNCPTCRGTGIFVSIGKAHEIPLRCPRCMGPPSVHTVPVVKMPALPPEATQIP
ncbi:MAG: hypothetical protein ABR562_00865 [Thermoplasmatota archaeon]|nr:hypothetical protein [Halobacteriales archaeon]